MQAPGSGHLRRQAVGREGPHDIRPFSLPLGRKSSSHISKFDLPSVGSSVISQV